MNQKYIGIKNCSLPVDIGQIPLLSYEEFSGKVKELLKAEENHCLNYFTIEEAGDRYFYCLIACDSEKNIQVLSHKIRKEKASLVSLTPDCPSLHVFEREIFENTGVEFSGHPWLKPLRYPHDATSKTDMADYPFYSIDSEELHEVGVGPVHAGVIEPGHFRFICNGEKVLHLEIQLGYQHRGIEKLFVEKDSTLRRCILSESIAGDTSVGHALAFTQIIESLTGIQAGESLQIERCIALELERMAVHIGDTAALCGDVAYQLGQVVCEALRTLIINTTQLWCGNRFGKGLIRPGGSNYPMTDNVEDAVLKVLDQTEKRFGEISDLIFSLPSVMARFEDIGHVTEDQARSIGAVGMAARTCGISRDIRSSHPFQYYTKFPVAPVILDSGDVLARAKMRDLEFRESVRIVRDLINIRKKRNKESGKPVYDTVLKPGSLAVALVEGWRGEICHIALTDNKGRIVNYKIKDTSLHNWLALALAVRNQEISDFPVCNKSFNLSYCGNDL
ncbi:MAG TPA: NADH-quinone oxidoreductase subunit C [Bacteroidales bacterium]|nr:NADH-quinone oxidoreductase subunit C [Bacteroidales bacterium]